MQLAIKWHRHALSTAAAAGPDGNRLDLEGLDARTLRWLQDAWFASVEWDEGGICRSPHWTLHATATTAPYGMPVWWARA